MIALQRLLLDISTEAKQDGEFMKIISWNCRGKFREKFSIIQKENADIYVIQECENPKKYINHFAEFLSDYIWYGENDSKGLGIFVQPHIKMEENNWPVYCLRHFISVKINDYIDLLGVWASPPYIEEYYIYQSINIGNYNENTVIIGDFNSNAIWDKDHGRRNHSAVVAELNAINIVSAYHHVTGEQAGKETQSTFYLYKHKDKKYHIDYCFLNPNLIQDFKILSSDKWIQYSDHMPIQIVI